MKSNFFFMVLMAFVLVVAGCESMVPGKIKLGGSYGDYSGFVEYEISAPQSQENKAPTLISKDGKELYVLDEKQVQALLDRIEGGESAKVSVKESGGKAIKKLKVYFSE